MAEFLVVSPLIKLVIDKLDSKVWKELGLLPGVEKNIEKMQSIISTTSDVLVDAEKRSIGDKPLCNWLKKLRDAIFDADDVVNEFQTEAMRRRMENHDHLKGQVTDFFSSHNQIAFRHRICQRIKTVMMRLQEIADERKNFHLSEGSVPQRFDERQTHSAVIESHVYGRDEDKETVINFLINEENLSNVSVLPIVGLGGIGKTTLAKLAYNDERIKSLFDLHIWVCISDDFDVNGITRKILECIKKEMCDHLQLEPLHKLLQETLGGKRFFLVLDDVWNEDEEKWESLKSLLSCGEKGSKIVVTTRSESVARIMGNVPAQKLKVLSQDHCWNLFTERAFGLGREEETLKLVEIGKEIVNKCGGLPLAAKALGSLMGSKRGEVQWSAIKNSEIWRLTDDENRILPALQLSYYHLPSHLKQCFLYCSLFPKDYEFDKKKLISLWIGEGFIPLLDQGMHPEDIGNNYFNSLLWSSFFQDVEKDDFGNIIACKMHDLVQDLACHVANDEFSMMAIREEIKPFSNCRYLSLITDSMSPDILNFSYETKKLRSLVLLEPDYRVTFGIQVRWDMLLKLRHLRVLVLQHSYISLLPSTICRLRHLRLLDLSSTSIETLPNTISQLYNLSTLLLAECSELKELPRTITRLLNLHTLDLSGCIQLQELPVGMSKLINLRHLNIYGCSLSNMPPGMGRLSNLQTLPMFIVDEEDGRRITELQHLDQIRGILEIRNLYKVESPTEAMEANLGTKIHLEQLVLKWGRGSRRGNAEEEDIIESLQPNPNLKVFKIHEYGGIRYPSWIMSSETEPPSSLSLFQNLVIVELYCLEKCECLPPLGHLPSLKCLSVRRMFAVRRIGEEFYGQPRCRGNFPLLVELELLDMPNLKEWVVETEEIERERMFPCLRRFSIHGCPELRVQPGLPMSIVDLAIVDIEGLLSAGSLAGLSRVSNLTIRHCSASASISWWKGLQYLTALSVVIIYRCDLPEGIFECHIPSLRTLEINWIENLTFVWDGEGGQDLQQQPPLLFTSLHHLKIVYCKALTALPEWLGCLTSLKYLHIDYCPNIQMLPDGLQHLTTLCQLRIDECPPLLEGRCRRETGEDWHKIAHIRDIQILPCAMTRRE